MQLAKVIGSMVSTRKCERLEGMKLLVAVPIDMETMEEKGAPFVTADTVGAGEGDLVFCAYGSSSRQSDTSKLLATDYTIFGIVDSLTLRGVRTYDKAKEAAHAAG